MYSDASAHSAIVEPSTCSQNIPDGGPLGGEHCAPPSVSTQGWRRDWLAYCGSKSYLTPEYTYYAACTSREIGSLRICATPGASSAAASRHATTLHRVVPRSGSARHGFLRAARHTLHTARPMLTVDAEGLSRARWNRWDSLGARDGRALPVRTRDRCESSACQRAIVSRHHPLSDHQTTCWTLTCMSLATAAPLQMRWARTMRGAPGWPMWKSSVERAIE
jgi:hypothetical protein